jgi:hypothetical protein
MPSGRWQSVTMVLRSDPSGFIERIRSPLSSRTNSRSERLTPDDFFDLVASSVVIFETASECFALLVGPGGRLRRLRWARDGTAEQIGIRVVVYRLDAVVVEGTDRGGTRRTCRISLPCIAPSSWSCSSARNFNHLRCNIHRRAPQLVQTVHPVQSPRPTSQRRWSLLSTRWWSSDSPFTLSALRTI